MGFLKAKLSLEKMMDGINVTWEYMKDSEYKNTVSKWRSKFEQKLIENRIEGESDGAVLALESELPITGYIFNLPNYKYLPVVPSLDS